MAMAAFIALATWMGSLLTRQLLVRCNILDKPNNRSSHSIPVPRGGGIPLITITVLGWLAMSKLGLEQLVEINIVVSMAMFIALVCWFDDVGELSIVNRLGAQILVVAMSIILIPINPSSLGLPGGLIIYAAIGLLWLWFINIFNFMDGIDGITSIETISICLGVSLTLGLLGPGAGFSQLAIILASSTAGFLVWNWQPAKLFLGDVGSIPLGFLIGWLLIEVEAQGEWAAAIILPGYYLTDATLTLLYRAVKFEPIWTSHRQHFYQRAVAGNLSHSQASKAIAITNMWLVSCALLSTIFTLIALINAVFGIVILLCYFQLASRKVRA